MIFYVLFRSHSQMKITLSSTLLTLVFCYHFLMDSPKIFFSVLLIRITKRYEFPSLLISLKILKEWNCFLLLQTQSYTIFFVNPDSSRIRSQFPTLPQKFQYLYRFASPVDTSSNYSSLSIAISQYHNIIENFSLECECKMCGLQCE
jgi:hypothetical protein